MANIFQTLGRKASAFGSKHNLPELHASETLDWLGRMTGAQAPTAFANAPFGTNPTPDQQSVIRGNPGVSDPSIGMANFTTPTADELANMPVDPAYGKNTVANATVKGNAPAYSNFGGAGGGAAAAPKEPNYRFVPGNPVPYDINDPGQRQAYLNDLGAKADDFQRTQEGQLETEFQRALRQSADYQGEQAFQLDSKVKDIGTRELNYGIDYDKRVNNFGKDYRIGSANRQNVFAAMGPNSYQSAQGDEQTASDEQYGTGLNDFTREKTQKTTAFKDERTFAEREKARLAQEYNDYIAETKDTLGKNLGKVKNYAADVRQGTVAELAPFDAADGITNFKDRYNLGTYNPTEVADVDVSKYTPAISFDMLPGQAGTAGGNVFSNLGKSQVAPVDDYLESTDQKTAADPLRKYLYGRA